METPRTKAPLMEGKKVESSVWIVTVARDWETPFNEILMIYSQCSGRVSKEKTDICFIPNTPEYRRIHVKQLLGISSEAFTKRYLGLPTAVGRITSGSFDHTDERCRAKVSCAARETLIKSVILVIPTYSMSFFLLTRKIL